MPENSKASPRPRDPRLDFFRGVAMFIIFVAHTPGNGWINWIPARFGFSDATEIFVFCSGMASAIAFGRVFETRGLFIGTARILFRVWQVYWAHLGLFFAVTVLLIGIDWLLDSGGSYTATLNLPVFFENARAGILGLMTLTYVPNYFDILPMYLGILLMVPVIVSLRWLHPAAPFVFSIALWAAAGRGWFDLPAEPWSDRTWFFNPFSWQLIFFTGFAFMRGWLPVPAIRKDWMIAAGVLVVATVPFAWHFIFLNVPALDAAAMAISPLTDKTHFGLFRYIHFLAVAYLAFSAVTLLGSRFQGALVDISRKVGQQSLGVFLASLVLAQIAGMVLTLLGHGYVATALVNLAGFASLVAVANVVSWFKGAPWTKPLALGEHGAIAGTRSEAHGGGAKKRSNSEFAEFAGEAAERAGAR
jgi:hypothetical protein